MVAIVISIRAQKQLESAFRYIHRESVQSAETFKHDIFSAITALADNPGKYPPDKYRKDNDGTFRAFELKSYRITYHTTEQKITITRVRHVKMTPMYY